MQLHKLQPPLTVGQASAASPEAATYPSEESFQQQLGRYCALNRKDLHELLKVVTTYGPQAPYTLSCLESVGGGGIVMPFEWK